VSIESYLEHHPRVAATAYVHPMAIVIGDVSIGDESSIWPAAVLRGDDGPIQIGAQTSIQDGSVLHTTRGESALHVGDRVTVGHNVTLHGCRVEDLCLIGMSAVILDNAVIGRGSVVGACALVTGGVEIPPGSLVLGSPARVIRPCAERERAIIEDGWTSYIERTREYRARDA